ncbi:putative transcription factor WD40-like family [Lupinus albus]|uniref:Putative transcription factor WD40-like family n=1 Tax=Lupinus albus TaxID=3870 RepID=A0A6A4PM19_LUPAL|nr:putative transcription factor WD40-like family [Lupinus albus]
MGSTTDIRGVLTAFSPSLDFFAITTGDGRVKIWDTLKGQLQTEFSDITSTDTSTNTYHSSLKGHLSIDYTCIKWLSFETKKKRKHASSLLVLGTGSGDVLAINVSAGQLTWRISDCHPGGVRAISSSANGSCIYTAGADGMICVINGLTGNLLEKFKASTKAVSSMSVSSDGRILATAASQLKVFNCSNHKKIQKFSGHPGSVRCMVFTEDDKYILSSGVGERYVAVWRINDPKKQSANCVLSMENPAVFLDSRCIDNGDGETTVCVLAISEVGVCYLWFGNSIEELRNAKPTKISLSLEEMSSSNYKGALSAIYAAKLQGIQKLSSGNVFLVYGLLAKPSFRKILVHSGTDIKLNFSRDGILLPVSQSLDKSKKGTTVQRVTALDRANAEDALLPTPKVFDSHDKEETFEDFLDKDATNDLVSSKADSFQIEDDMVEGETDVICMEDRMRSLGILNSQKDCASNFENSTLLKGIDLKAAIPMKKIKATVVSMVPNEAFKLLEVLLAAWQSSSYSAKYVLPWIYSILVNHGHTVIAEDSATHMLDSLHKIINTRGATLQPLLQLSGRLQLMTSQIDKASQTISDSVHDHKMEESGDEDEEDEYFHEEGEDESEISSDDES